MAENQEPLKPKEREIPVFTVLKNNCILKNIFVLDNPPPISPSFSENADREPEREEILLVGRHPDCNIKLEHPSISRFHLRIHSKPSSRSLFVTDLSSVHGTCISGKRIEAGVTTELVPGDTLKLGESSRLYRLDWVPISSAYETNHPFVPQLDSLDTVYEEVEGADQDENSLPLVSEEIKGLGWQFPDENLVLSIHEEATMLKELGESYQEMEEEEETSIRSPEMSNEENKNYLCELGASITADEETERVTDQDGDSLLHKSESVEHLEQPIWDADLALTMQKMRVETPLQVEDEFSSSQLCQMEKKNTTLSEDEVENIGSAEKENTPQAHNRTPVLQEVFQAETMEAYEMNSEKRIGINIWSRRGKSEGVKIKTSRSKAACARIQMTADVKSVLGETCIFASPDKDEDVFTPDKENASPDSCLVRSLGSKFDEAMKSESILDTPISSAEEGEENFTSDKENMTPNSNLFMSMKKIGNNKDVRHQILHKPSPLKEVFLEERKSTYSTSKSHCSSKVQPYALSVKAGKREPFLPLPIISTGDDKPSPIQECRMKERKSINNCRDEGSNQSHRSTTKVSEKRWTIVVDTISLLNKTSRRELQLLRGLRGTSLFVPRIVLRELDCMVRRASFLSRMTEASAALKWIEECMASTTWWIHVQSSAEESRLVPPTPPAASAHWFGEDKGAFSVGSIPFSPYSLQEIVTPTAADHILDSALFFKQTTNGQLVLLSDDVTLKIKAMAEGVLCETAKEFRASLVNPFSTRFLYSDSSPRGPTWTCVDDTVLKEKYYPSPSKKATKSGDGAKGLKLILLHNSNFRQMRA